MLGFCQLNVNEGGRGVHWTPAAFYLNIYRTIENTANCFCISSDIQCVTKILDRISCTCLVYCLDDPKQFSFNFFLKNAQLLNCEE